MKIFLTNIIILFLVFVLLVTNDHETFDNTPNQSPPTLQERISQIKRKTTGIINFYSSFYTDCDETCNNIQNNYKTCIRDTDDIFRWYTCRNKAIMCEEEQLCNF